MIRFVLAPPRHPLARFALAVGGVVIIALLSVIGVAAVAAAVLALGGRALWLRLRGDARGGGSGRRADPQIIEGEFTVVEPERLPRR